MANDSDSNAKKTRDNPVNLFESGHSACAGCGPAIAMRTIVNTLGSDIVVVNATSCMEIVSSKYPQSAWRVPYIHSIFENGPAVASGVARALKAEGNNHTRVVYIGGDGGTYDIGMAAFSGALERNEDCIFICYDNNCYANCLSPSTLIMTENGLKQITGVEEGERVYAFDRETRMPVLKRCTGVFNNGTKPVLELVTPHHSIRATPNHPFLTLKRNGRGKTNELKWKALAELKPGDEIVTLKKLDGGKSYSFKPIKVSKKGDYKVNKINDARIPNKTDADLMELLGIYVGDGWTRLNKAEIGFAVPQKDKARKRLLDLIRRTFAAKITETKDENEVHIRSVNVARLIDSLGFGKGSKNKTIPSWVFTLPIREKEAFVRGLILSDGYVSEDCSMRYVSASHDLLKRLRLLLQGMDYRVGKIHWRTIEKGSYVVYRELLKSTAAGYVCFSKKKELKTKKYKSQYRYRNFLVDNDHFEIARITSVRPVEIEPTFDLRVEGAHNFIADGIVVHNTGVQRSSATPHFAATTTSPAGKRIHGKPEPRKHIGLIAAAHNIPYIAAASIGNLPDLKRKILKAKETRGASFILIHAPGPLEWRFDPSLTIKIAKLAIETGATHLYEMEKGVLTLNVEPKFTPIEEFLKLQGRFKHLTPEEVAQIQKEMKMDWAALKVMERIGKG